MNPDKPIACSLSAAEMPERLAEMRALGDDALLSVRQDGALRFRADDATRGRLEAIIAAESQCCSFLEFDVREEGGALALTIVAPEGAEPLASELASAFAAGAKVA